MNSERDADVAAAEETSVVNLSPSELPAEAVGRVVVVPWGEVASTNGGFVVDAVSARQAVEEFEKQGNDLPIDYEHQSLGGRYTSPTGQAPAAGWIKRLEVVEGEGLVAHVEWTESALSRLAGREYRYLSPVVIVRKRDRRLVALHSAALTNKPAIARMRPIVNSEETTESMEATTVAKEADSMDSTWDALRERLGLEASADEETLLVAASQRLEALQAELALRDAEETATAAMKTGKLTSAQKAWAIELIQRDPDGFESWFASAPVVVPHGRMTPPEAEACGEGRRTSVAAAAKREYRSNRLLESLTCEEAYVADALREAGLE